MTRVASRSIWSIAVFLLAFAGSAPAQPILTGTVLGLNGRPLVGARVELVPVLPDFEQARRGLESAGESAPVKTSDTDAAGRFTLRAPETGIWMVAVRSSGLNPFASSPLPLVAPRELAPIALSPVTAPISPLSQGEVWQDVRLLDRSGAPVQGAVLRGDQKRPFGRTDAQGRLRLPVPASGSIRLQMLLADGRQIGAELTRSASERTFTLADPAVLAGQVVDEKGRKPIAGALVWTTLDPGAFVRTDAQGHFRLPAPWRRRFEVEVLAAGFLAKKVTIPVPHLASGRVAVLALTRAAAVRGKVTDPSGRPLPGATVLAIPAAAVGERAFDPSAPVADRAVSDAQGGFTLPHLRPDETYEVRASRAGAFPAFQRLTLGDALAGPRTLNLVLAPARAARGKVQDSTGKPIEGAEIVLRPALRPGALRVPSPSGEPAGPDAVTVQSDGKGVFSIAACPAPEFELQVRKKGYVPAILPALRLPAETKPAAGMKPGGPADLGIITLRPGARLTGRVADRRDRAISDAQVFALERLVGINEVEGALKGRKPAATTGADGHFTIEDLAKGTPVHLIVRSPGFLTQGVRAVRPPTEKPLVIRMEVANLLRGRVVDESGAPIPGARLELRWQDHLPEERERRIGEPLFRGARTDADGRFEIREIPTGSAYLGVTASGFVPIEGRELELPRSPETGELRLVLDRGAILQGRVTAASGEPVPGTRVGAAGVSALTDDDGLYWLEGVATGPGDVLVIHPSHGRLVKPFDIQPGVNVLDASFDPGVEVTGRVIDDAGRPVTGARVDLGTDSRFARKQYQDVTGEDGRFRLMPVADGRYLLSAEAEGFSETAAAAAVEVAGQPVANLEITLDRGAVLSGEIIGLAPEDLAKVSVEARGERGATADAWTDGRGRYEVRSLRPGDWVVRARLWDGQRQAQVRVSIGRSDREVTRDLEFDKRLTLSAQVLYDEEPLPEAKVALRGERRAIERIVTTDYEGRFRLDDLEADTYRLGLNHPGKMLVHNDRIELQADREVTIRLQAATIGGLVVSQANGEPVDGALILLQPVEGPEFMVSGGTKEDGRFALYRVPPGSYRMKIRAQGFGPAERQVQVAGGEVRDDLEIRLSPTQGTKLQVRLASGQVPEFVHVLVRDPSGATVLAESRRPDPDGMLELSTLSPGSWTLLAAADGGAMVSLNLLVPSEPMAVALPPAGRLLVRVPALAASELIGTLQLIGTDQQPLRTLGFGGQLQQQWSLIGGKGMMEGVPAGAWILQVETADGQRWQGAAVTSGIGEAAVAIE